MNAKYIKYAIALFTTVTAIFIGTPVNTYAKEETINYMGEGKQVQTDESHSKKSEHDLMHVHDGWNLGRFCVRGFSGTPRTDEKDVVYLKNPGDKIKLSFQLDQDINKLNGQENLSISNNKKGYDDGFNIPEKDATNFGKGTLLIKKTDYKNETTCEKPYVDYLKAVEKGADTDVVLFEEGDYEVALDYDIQENMINIGNINTLPVTSHFQIKISFKVRNGNNAMFTNDIVTGSELHDKDVTEDGFVINLQNSKYIQVTVEKKKYNAENNSFDKESRYSKVATDGEKFTDEGIYVINAHNPYLSKSDVCKTVVVEKDPVKKAQFKTGKSISAIESELNKGATIAKDGSINPAVSKNSLCKQRYFMCCLIAIFILLCIPLILIINLDRKESRWVREQRNRRDK